MLHTSFKSEDSVAVNAVVTVKIAVTAGVGTDTMWAAVNQLLVVRSSCRGFHSNKRHDADKGIRACDWICLSPSDEDERRKKRIGKRCFV